MSRVGVVPAAGYATRLQPLASSKEMLEVGGRPVMGYLLDRLRRARCAEIRVVTRPEKADVVELVNAEGAQLVLAHPETLTESVLVGAAGLGPGDIALIGFPDSVWSPEDGFATLAERVEAGADAALGLFRMDEPERSDVVTVREDGVVECIDVRPQEPVSNVIWGCAAVRVSSLGGLRKDLQLGEFLGTLARERTVIGIQLSERYVDIGTREALERAASLEMLR